MLDDCVTNQHRKGHARAQIIADAAHCRGCRRFWADGRQTGSYPETGVWEARQGMTLSQEQLNAACDEAKKQGLRTLVHAYKEAVRAATLAGCTEVEHGTLAPDDDLKLTAEKGTYFDPQAGLVIENYLLNKEKYLGTAGYTAEGFAAMEKILPMDHEMVRHATNTPGLKIVFGTDAVAGAHGRNAEEFVDRVRDCGVDPMAAMVSANGLGSQALGMADQIGSIAPGLQ